MIKDYGIAMALLIFVISYIQSYFPAGEKQKKILGRFHGIGANVVSALLGTVTPFLFVLIHTAVH